MKKTVLRSLLAFVLLVCVVLLAFGAGRKEEPTPAVGKRWQREIVIGWTPPDITGVFRTATNFFEAAARDGNDQGFDIEVISQSPATHIAFADQVAIIEDYIQRRVDIIVISPVEVEVIRPVIAKANAAGIPVIMANLLEPIAGVDVKSYVGFDNGIASEVIAYAILDYFGGPGVLGTGRRVEVTREQYLDIAFWRGLYGGMSPAERAAIRARGAIIEGVAGGFFSVARLNGFRRVMDQFPGITFAGVPIAGDWNRAKSIKATEDIMQANPTGLDFIWASSSEMGLGAMLATEAAGRNETVAHGMVLGDTRIAVFTQGVTPESVARLNEGRLIADSNHGFADWGWYGTEFAVRVVCGIEVPKIFDIRPRIAYQGNASIFFPNPVMPKIDWADIKAKSK